MANTISFNAGPRPSMTITQGAKTGRLPPVPSVQQLADELGSAVTPLVPSQHLKLTPGVVLTKDNIDSFGRQTGKPMYAFKVSAVDGTSPMHWNTSPKLVCQVGAHLMVANADKNWRCHCAPGVNVATIDWCLREYDKCYHARRHGGKRFTVEGLRKRYKLWLVRFFTYDIACIPNSTDGKIRLTHCVVYKEIKSTSSLNATLRKLNAAVTPAPDWAVKRFTTKKARAATRR